MGTETGTHCGAICVSVVSQLALTGPLLEGSACAVALGRQAALDEDTRVTRAFQLPELEC